MLARQWTTDDQLLWLDNHITAFTGAQKKKTTNAFFKETHHIWQEKWPTEDPTEQELQRAEGNIERTLAVKRKELEKVSSLKQTPWKNLPDGKSSLPSSM